MLTVQLVAVVANVVGEQSVVSYSISVKPKRSELFAKNRNNTTPPFNFFERDTTLASRLRAHQLKR